MLSKSKVKTYLNGTRIAIENLKEAIEALPAGAERDNLLALEASLHTRLNVGVHALADLFEDEEVRSYATARTGGEDKPG